ncbi:MAG: hypothetical protein A2X12_06485 [Bacteroidetes bacterium GWE2_29_8]|nr:MAG: hypothetical protein A2X12_06485 [Bacteroidetes bacterium GWE2_29_8]
MDLFLIFVIIIILLLLSGLFSGAEIAFFSLSPNDKNNLKNHKNGKLVLQLMEKPKQLLATIIIGNNFVNIAIVVISTFITKSLVIGGNLYLTFLIQVFAVTSLILFFGEIIPKIYVSKNPLNFSLKASFILSFFIKILSPFSYLLVSSTGVIDKKLKNKQISISREELSHAIDLTSKGESSEEDKKILQGVFKIGDIDVKEVMTSRLDIVSVNIVSSFNDICNIVIESGYSRIPVYENSLDNIKGVLYIKDIMPYINMSDDFYKWQKHIREPFFIPETKRLDDLLKNFQLKKIHLAIVVDEFGGTSGIITLENIVEEIVGEINDEFDVTEDELIYSKIDERNYIFEGKTKLIDFIKVLDINESVFESKRGDSDTIAGLILEMEGEIPSRNKIIKFDKFSLVIDAVDKRRIKKVRVIINEESND